MPESKKVLLGMSGGVDSSVSAILLKEQGYDVTGITLHLFEGGCCDSDSTMQAKMICKKIGIEHVTINQKELFKEKVINNFIDEYRNCRTPNPCIVCNKFLKFGIMYEVAKKLGINYIATGHYAKKEFSSRYNRYVIKKARNVKKDQSYFLYNIEKELIPYIIFPLNEYETKDEIRQIARNYNLEVANKPDSEDICFITNGNYKEFLENNSDIKPTCGNIVDLNGKILGRHEGLYRYTIGQRKGLGISNSVPLFVIGFNKEKNEVIVGEEELLYQQEIFIEDANLLALDFIERPVKVRVKTRYTAVEASAVVVPTNQDNNSKQSNFKIIFDNPQRALTPGQSAVFYDEEGILIGGGIIKSKI